MMRKVLIVVDMQNDFVTGVLGSNEAVKILPNVKKKIEQYMASGDEIIYTRDTHFDSYLDTNEGKHLPVKHCIKDTDGWQIVSDIDNSNYKHVDKHTFGYSDWNRVLTEIQFENTNGDVDFIDICPEEIEIIGVCTDICVVSNALILKALCPEAELTVDASCCAGVTPESHRAALETMKSCQINVVGE
jgi:nicotinamidase-related amidase